jgi:hypothetical protein
MSEPSPRTRTVRRISDDELLSAAAEATNMRELLRALGIASYGGNYDSIRRRLGRLGALSDRFLPLRDRPAGPRRFTATSDELYAAVASARTKADVLRTLGYDADPSLYRRLNKQLKAAGVATEHLRGRSWSRGVSLPPRQELAAILRRGSVIQTTYLRRRLLREGVFAHRCAGCGLGEWEGRPIPLELDHIDGDRTNNELGNLRLLCPNCHALTDTYRGRNVGRPHQDAAIELAWAGEDVRLLAKRRLASIVGPA